MERRRADHDLTCTQQKGVANDLGLLLQAIAGEGLAGLDCVVVPAPGMTGEGKIDAALVLPDVHPVFAQTQRIKNA
ncbi:hypothetical protein FHS94_002068 [Sphingomonas aerophila]|uniref:Uncharacterized protein n=1 Tax=Sphingomonas aerophila TaxID=1344948 RepID=A0A7W9EW00_9SPHN|nr:hypothetical protein [Sphingomonas aerophila]